MKNNINKIAGLIAFMLLSGNIQAELKWFDSMDVAKKEARKSKKPILVFNTIGDSACDKQESDLTTNESLLTEEFNYVCVKIDQSKKKIKDFNQYPTLQFMSPSGDELLLFRSIGYRKTDEVRFNLRKVLELYTFKEEALPFATLSKKSLGAADKEITIECDMYEDGLAYIKVIDYNDKVYKTIIKEIKKKGKFKVAWDGNDEKMKPVPKGAYLIVFELGSYKDIIQVKVEK